MLYPTRYDDKPTGHGQRSSSISEGESIYRVPTDEISEKSKPKSFNFENGDSEKHTVRSWNSQYLQCQPMIVVAKPNNSLADEHEKPLGLPIRSLRSRIVDPTRPKPRARSGCGSSSSSKSNSMDSLNQECSKNVNFGGMESVSQEQKFDETVSLPSPIPWRSRSGKMEMRENLSAIKQPPLHSRHFSVEESQFMKQSSFRSYSNASSSSNQSTVTSNDVSELLESRLEKLGKEKCNQSASSVDSFFVLNSDFHEKPKSSDGEEFSQNGVSELLESRLEKLGKDKGDQLASASSFFKWNAEKDLWAKRVSDGEELNSIKSNQSAVNSSLQTEVSEFSHSASVGSFFEFNADLDLQSKLSGGEEFNSSSMKNGLNAHQYSKSLSDSGHDTEKVDEFLGEVRKKGDQKRKASIFRGKSVRTFQQRAESKKTEQTQERTRQDLAKSRSGSNQSFLSENFDREETTADDSVSDAGTEANEVDKKAGEFIAKFREQIRLQKAGSIDGSVSLDFDRVMFT